MIEIRKYILFLQWCIIKYLLDMKQTFKALLLIGGILITSVSGYAKNLQKENLHSKFEGTWVFEKAEYMERDSLQGSYEVKYTIDKVENLEALIGCYHYVVKQISIGSIAVVECPFARYYGSVTLVTIQYSEGDRVLMEVGNVEEIGKETPIEGVYFNAPNLHYWIDKVDDHTLCLTLEEICHEDGKEKHGAVKCILKKN